MQKVSFDEMDCDIAILIPCLNEEKTIAKVVSDFKTELPNAKIYVFDNNSSDRSAQFARQAGAEVVSETRKGKGMVVQAMFQKIEADIYVMVDGDDTYPASKIHLLIEPILYGRADMTIGSRIMKGSKSKFRLLNLLGNKMFQGILNIFFSTRLTDILSGYRAMNRRLIKNLPLFESGFEIEAELTIKALERRFVLQEIPVDLKPRQFGSHSKIKIVEDGIKILGTIFALFRDYKPLTFFGLISILCILLSPIPGIRFIQVLGMTNLGLGIFYGLLSLGLILAGLLFLSIGLILHTINRRFREMEYLQSLWINKDAEQS